MGTVLLVYFSLLSHPTRERYATVFIRRGSHANQSLSKPSIAFQCLCCHWLYQPACARGKVPLLKKRWRRHCAVVAMAVVRDGSERLPQIRDSRYNFISKYFFVQIPTTRDERVFGPLFFTGLSVARRRASTRRFRISPAASATSKFLQQ